LKYPKKVVFEFPDGDEAHGFVAYMSDGGGEQQAQPPDSECKERLVDGKWTFERVEIPYGLDFDYGFKPGKKGPRVVNGAVVIKVKRYKR
jgi:hypothetical protein